MKYAYHCPVCRTTFCGRDSNAPLSNPGKCAKCSLPLKYSGYEIDAWRDLSTEEKDAVYDKLAEQPFTPAPSKGGRALMCIGLLSPIAKLIGSSCGAHLVSDVGYGPVASLYAYSSYDVLVWIASGVIMCLIGLWIDRSHKAKQRKIYQEKTGRKSEG